MAAPHAARSHYCKCTARDEDKNDRQDGTLKFSVVDAGGAPIKLQTFSFDVPWMLFGPLFLGIPGSILRMRTDIKFSF